MKLGLVSAILAEYTFEQVIDYLSDNKLDSVEIACWPIGKSERRYAGVTHIDVDSLDASKASYYNGYLKEKGVEIAAMTFSPNPLTPDLKQREAYIVHIKKVIKSAALMGVLNVNTFIGKDQRIPIEANMKEFSKVWPDIVKFAEDSGVTVNFENCPMYFTMDEWPGGKNLASFPSIWREIFSIIDSKYFGMNYDPSHLVWQRMDYIKPIYEFKNKITNVHAKDAKFYQDKYDDKGILATPLEYHSPKIPGLGDINWSVFISALTDIEFAGSVLIEIEDRSFDATLQDKLRGISISKKHLSQFFG